MIYTLSLPEYCCLFRGGDIPNFWVVILDAGKTVVLKNYYYPKLTCKTMAKNLIGVFGEN